MGLRITVPPEGRVVINSAVIQNRSKSEQADLCVLNHANVIRGKNIMQAEEATTPVRRAYFLMQSIIMENAEMDDPRLATFDQLLVELLAAFEHPDVVQRLREGRRLAADGAVYKAMMALKPVMKYEDAVLALGQAIEVEAGAGEAFRELVLEEG
ncbi:hypothetical protein CKO28_16010 [Rhodovibrio sodomensis]|uniref:Flagellar biosynthesis repressor FlbT n=1 Tax=Rhodovibrio sodomensis TaxID=1088 RepID=A0ABS1DI79_9PROT|nr:flagellar biosynthesis repressor FlbT [Rhodovibrio sodomensis]MBK1669544.1 hypothetical protein [Rhodovibrio sodomensis]